jgi:UDP-N-acetylmuramoylalanine--D-glutamate ligase
VTGRRVVVVGFGVTGRSATRALVADGDEVVVVDDSPAEGAADVARRLGASLVETPAGASLRELIAGSSLVVPSPGVPVGHPVFAAAAEAEVPVWSEIELASRIAAEHGGPRIVAVTGTNGKTTVTTLVNEMLESSGLKTVASGNIGLPMIDAIESESEVVVAEVSSFQLQFTEHFRPGVSCWLNLSPDHLDWHPTTEHYAAAKARIWSNQGAGDVAVINADDRSVMAASATIPEGVERITFSRSGAGDYHADRATMLGPGGIEILAVSDLPRSFPHDVSNALAAAAVAIAAGGSVEGCREAMRAQTVLPHRVGRVGERGGVAWYDDSKATTPASVLAAVAGFASVVLIAGGRNKGLDLGVLGGTVPPVKAVVAIGEATPEILAAFAGLVPTSVATSMHEAVEAAAAFTTPGDSVLLSPGCASFDWYRSYAERGDDFASIVTRRLHEGEGQC